MPAPRSPASRNSPTRSRAAPPSHAAGSSFADRLRPDLSRRGLVRVAGRTVGVCAVVGVMTVAAGWHASGMVRRGEIQRMVRMSANLPAPAAAAKARGGLDRKRLETMASSASR